MIAEDPFDCRWLVTTFNDRCGSAYRTVLVPGGAEPLYQPATIPAEPHRIVFRADYVASALHEVAHWCLAGPDRRRRIDYGYWYAPHGRDARAQCAFERVEARPQALEWIFADAVGHPFRPSLDNLAARPADYRRFDREIWTHKQELLRAGLPVRAVIFLGLLRGTDISRGAARR